MRILTKPLENICVMIQMSESGLLDYFYSIGLSVSDCNYLLYINDPDRPDYDDWKTELKNMYIEILGMSKSDAELFAFDENRFEYWEWFWTPHYVILKNFEEMYYEEIDIWGLTPEQIVDEWIKMECRKISEKSKLAMLAYWRQFKLTDQYLDA